MVEKKNACRIFVKNLGEEIPPGRPGRRWVDNIKIDHKETRWGGMDWIDLAQDRYQW
jgi:hypothetical protein